MKLDNSNPPPPHGPTPGTSKLPEGRTQGGAQKLGSDTTTLRGTEGRTQEKGIRAQKLKTDGVDGMKKGRKAHRASEQAKACILLQQRIIRSFDQNVCPVRGTYYANKRTYMGKF